MASTEFHDRINRINQANAERMKAQRTPMRGKSHAITAYAKNPRAAKLRAKDGAASGQYFVPSGVGLAIGLLVAILNLGAVQAGSPWGPGTALAASFGLIGSTGVVLTLPMLLVSLLMRQTKPGFFFFSMTYCIAVIASLFV